MRIAIVGGHGKVARLLTPLLINDGHGVSSIIRNPEQTADIEELGATPVVTDIEQLDVAGLANAFDGHDAIVWAAGAGGGNPPRTYAVDRDAAIRSFEAAERAGVNRYVMVSYFGAGPDHGVPEDEPFFAYAESKAQADEALRSSGLDWTIVQPSGLSDDEGTGRIDVGADEADSVSREDVATVIAAVLADPSTAGRSIRFNRGDTPIGEAIPSG
ncbi:SDR family oxidoreductase [Salinibacterium sp. SYSU T00001]|uniref:SDR family oxidoreductase n=1 Tax=Homoserinimonas sedimenticola TaxID=2986805 RepID=UPI0022359CA1|nr:SDR family oxidoreductase [Salinibacterium sedimenticola]MCW4386005.1 SDR family oxidoreductase [Salinibacterium sedimenticola]